MKLARFTSLNQIVWLGLLVPATLVAQSSYHIQKLDGLGGTIGGGNSINNRAWVTGSGNKDGDAISHATLWVNGGAPIDIGTLGSANLNSTVAWPVKNTNGLIVGISDTNDDNPLGEAFSCWAFFAPGVPTGKICKGFQWRNGVMKALSPFAGGYDSYATAANERGQIVGWAENGVFDSTCDPASQRLQFRAVIWEPNGEMRELPPLPGDSTSAATAINDRGEVVGISGACGVAIGSVSAAHAVLWENGVPIDIGNLGGHSWNTPTAINNQGTVVGFSLLSGQDGSRNYEAFVWTRKDGIHSLGKPAGDIRSAAFGINERGQIVGLSRGGPHLFRAMLWENGKMIDLNTVTETGSPFLLYANDINDRGEIAGQAFDVDTGESPAFMGVPSRGESAGASGSRGGSRELPEKVRQQLRQRLGFDLGADE